MMLLRGLVYISQRTRWHLGGIWGRLVLRLYGVKFGHHLRIGSAPMVQRNRNAKIWLGNDVVTFGVPGRVVGRVPSSVAQPKA